MPRYNWTDLAGIPDFNNSSIIVNGGDALVVLGDFFGGHGATADHHPHRLVLLLQGRHDSRKTSVVYHFEKFASRGTVLSIRIELLSIVITTSFQPVKCLAQRHLG